MNFQDFFEKMSEGPMAKTYAVFRIFLDHPTRKYKKKDIYHILRDTGSYYYGLWTNNGMEKPIPESFNNNVPTALNDKLKKLEDEHFIKSSRYKNADYFYLAPSFRKNWKFKPKELEQLNNISELLTWHEMFKKYEGLPLADELRRAFLHEFDKYETKQRKSAHVIVDFETPYVKDKVKYYIEQCYSCVEECLIIDKIIYLSYYQPNKEPDVIEVRNFRPYLLKISKGQWYLIGKSANDPDFRHIALNRIKELVPTEDEFVRENYNPSEYWKHSIGITRSDYPQKLSFKVKNGPLYNNIDYLINNPILPEGTKTVITGEWMEVVINKIHLGPELVRTLRSIGRENIKDLNPGWLNEDLWERNYKQEVRFNIELNSEDQVRQFTKLSKEKLRISKNNDNAFAEFSVGPKIPRVKKREVVIKNITINAVFAHYVYYLLDAYKKSVNENQLYKLIEQD